MSNNVLRVLGGLTRAAGKGFEGYGVDQQIDVKNVLAHANAAREAERDRVLNALTNRQIAKPQLGDEGYAELEAGVDKAKAEAVSPITTQTAVNTAKGLAPIQEGTHLANRKADVANPLPQTNQQHFTFLTGADENGKPVVMAGNTKTGDLQQTGQSGKGTGGTSSGGAAMIKARAGNISQLAIIDDALKELEAHPGAVGLMRGIPIIGDRLDPRADPEGVGARASIANIGSLKIHDRSGAAVSVNEFPRLAPFVPSITDPPEAIKVKLQKLRDAIQVETDALAAGTGPTSSRKSPAQLWDAAVAKYGKQVVELQYGPRPPE